MKSEDQSSLSVEPITTILLNGNPPSHIKCEPLDPCDVDESDTFEECVTDKWTDESEFLHSNPLADVECEPSILSIEKRVTFDKAVSITDLPIISPGITLEIHLKINKRLEIVGSNEISPENGISQSEDTVSSNTVVTCDLCKRFVSNIFQLPEKHIRLLGPKFINENVRQCSVCQECKKELSKNVTSSISQPSRNEDALTLFFGNSLWQAQAE